MKPTTGALIFLAGLIVVVLFTVMSWNISLLMDQAQRLEQTVETNTRSIKTNIIDTLDAVKKTNDKIEIIRKEQEARKPLVYGDEYEYVD